MAIIASLGIALGACSDAAGPTSPIAGYALTSFNSRTLPAVMFAEEGYRLEITGGVATLKADSTFSLSTTVIETVDGNKSTYIDTESGRWLQGNAGEITFTLTGGEVFLGIWSGTTLSLSRAEMAFGYTMTDD